MDGTHSLEFNHKLRLQSSTCFVFVLLAFTKQGINFICNIHSQNKQLIPHTPYHYTIRLYIWDPHQVPRYGKAMLNLNGILHSYTYPHSVLEKTMQNCIYGLCHVKLSTFKFNEAVRSQGSEEVENVHTAYNFGYFDLPKVIQIDENFTETILHSFF